ncbi:hypothetical protein D9M69_706250 [compost metagenome]
MAEARNRADISAIHQPCEATPQTMAAKVAPNISRMIFCWPVSTASRWLSRLRRKCTSLEFLRSATSEDEGSLRTRSA